MSPKRGLIYIGNRENQADNKYWAASGTSMTWYYNYGFYQTRVMQNSNLQYVPMLWGAPASGTEVDFQKQVKGYKDGGMNITYVLGFNEPDHTKDGGGSDIPLADAVRHWKSEMEPTRNLGVKLGSPATVGNVGGIQWLQSFIKACNGCHIDFIALHYYGSFEGMASYIGQARDAFRNVTNEFWLTEFALPAAPLDGTERAFNQSVGFLDNANNSDISRYSYFGSLRSSASPAFTGHNVAFINTNGKLTNMGRWYLGDNFTEFSSGGASSGMGEALQISAINTWIWTLLFMSIWLLS